VFTLPRSRASIGPMQCGKSRDIVRGLDGVTGGFTAALYRQNQGELLTLAHTMTDLSTVYGGLIELWPDDSVETFEMVFEKAPDSSVQAPLHPLPGREVCPGREWVASLGRSKLPVSHHEPVDLLGIAPERR